MLSGEVIGECSICGGDVCVPRIWHGVNPPKPRCNGCGAVARSGPVIDMRPANPRGYRGQHSWKHDGPYTPPYYTT